MTLLPLRRRRVAYGLHGHARHNRGRSEGRLCVYRRRIRGPRMYLMA